MTATAWVVLAVAAAAAILDWYAVATHRRRLEYVCKPLTMAALVALALVLVPDNPARRGWFVAAGVFSLVGDVLLMLPRDRFVGGLVAFLVAHVCYVAGLVTEPLAAGAAAVGLAVVAAALVAAGLPVMRAVRRDAAKLLPAVVAYALVISAMVVVAFAGGVALAVAGALLFYASDGILAWRRFVHPLAWAPVAIMVTYHLGQAGLVLSLA